MNSATITSPANRLVKTLASLQERKHRDALGLVWAEGRRVADAALRGAWPAEMLVLATGATDVDGLAARAAARGAQVVRMHDDCFARISGVKHAEGIAAVLRRPGGVPLPGAPRRTLVLWQLQDPGNAGTIVRSAVAFGCRSVVAVGPCVDLCHPQAVRATAGALFETVVHTVDEGAALAWLRCHAARAALLSAEAAVPLPAMRGGAIDLIVVGNEPRGLPAMLDDTFQHAAIPMAAGVGSLNVTAAAAIALYELWGAPSAPSHP